MTAYLGKSCSFCLPRVPFVNCRQFMYLVISLLVLRAGYGIWLYQFLIIAYLFILNLRDEENPDDIGILLCAYVGFAAFNLSGQTICSAFHKKIYQGTSFLSADELNTFRIKYRHLKVIIIDEISMVGNKTLSFIDTRLRRWLEKKQFSVV